MTMNLTLNNGVQMPALGFGVFQTPPDVTAQAVGTALATGYRLIDTAAAYGNEREVGQAIRHSGLARDDVFIETKIWISDYGYDQTLHAFDKSAGKLGVDRIDLLILHQALPTRFDLTQQAYRALQTLLADGRVRAIGVSNFMPEHLDALLKQATVVPAVNQVEVHPYFTQPAVQAADAAHGVLTQAWSPIGGITSYRGTGTSTFDDPAIASIAAAHGKTPAQVMIRWHLQEGRSAIPKSVRPERIAQNFDVFDFELTTAELKALDALDTGRVGDEGRDDREQVQQAEHQSDGRRGVAYRSSDPEAEQGDERQVQDRAGGGPDVGARGEGRVPVRGSEPVAGEDQPPGERGTGHRQRRGDEHRAGEHHSLGEEPRQPPGHRYQRQLDHPGAVLVADRQHPDDGHRRLAQVNPGEADLRGVDRARG